VLEIRRIGYATLKGASSKVKRVLQKRFQHYSGDTNKLYLLRCRCILLLRQTVAKCH